MRELKSRASSNLTELYRLKRCISVASDFRILTNNAVVSGLSAQSAATTTSDYENAKEREGYLQAVRHAEEHSSRAWKDDELTDESDNEDSVEEIDVGESSGNADWPLLSSSILGDAGESSVVDEVFNGIPASTDLDDLPGTRPNL